MTLRKVIASGARLSPPDWLADNLLYETLMGSVAYGVSSDASDVDVYGICMPPKHVVFPHLAGEILGIVKFFQLAMENNPNIIDSLFTPRRCVLSSTAIGEYMREHRVDFLHKGAWHKFKGYAYSQLHKIQIKVPQGKRAELVDAHGYDVKFGYHVVRLLLEVEQILVHHDIDLERDREQLKAIRRGEWPLERLMQWAQDKEKALEAVYHSSPLRYGPDEALIKRHLLHCLEAHYGDLSSAVVIPGEADALLAQIADLTRPYRSG